MTSFRGLARWAKNDVTQGKANSTGIAPDPISKQSRVTNLLSLNTACISIIVINCAERLQITFYSLISYSFNNFNNIQTVGQLFTNKKC